MTHFKMFHSCKKASEGHNSGQFFSVKLKWGKNFIKTEITSNQYLSLNLKLAIRNPIKKGKLFDLLKVKSW